MQFNSIYNSLPIFTLSNVERVGVRSCFLDLILQLLLRTGEGGLIPLLWRGRKGEVSPFFSPLFKGGELKKGD